MPTKITDSKNYHIVLLRHGESIANAQGYYQGQTDFTLTEIGKKQAHSLAKWWQKQGVTFDLIISSPLMRARQTAEIISSILELPLEFDPLWMERDAGLLSGLHQDDAEQLYPQPSFTHIYQPIGTTGESQWELYLRAGRALSDLLRRAPGRYLVVSHGGILNMVLYTILGIVPQANFHGVHFRFENTAYALLTYYPTHHYWYFEELNKGDRFKEIIGSH